MDEKGVDDGGGMWADEVEVDLKAVNEAMQKAWAEDGKRAERFARIVLREQELAKMEKDERRRKWEASQREGQNGSMNAGEQEKLTK